MQQPRPGPSPQAKQLLAVVWVGGLLTVGLVLLWAADVVPTAVLLGGFVVVFVVEVLMTSRFRRRAAEQLHRRRQQPPGGVSTLGPDSPAAGYGYDPMADGERRR
ncbi:hypothetical protein [uncultured Georgenia sp.]|uniref:hypothetical protein n=1 Tax=uncultured Georgenia sp. TaxID=378209 RepID=UPI00261E03F1|nr:hypothetical protein [uncultured Georgenia sp.]HLV04183.1 hypothetical protein [Actinomycetaceae bacterium]